MFKKGLLVCSVSAFFLSGCKDDKVEPPVVEPSAPKLEIKIETVFNQQSLTPGMIVTTVEGYDVQFDEIKFFATDGVNNGVTLFDAALFDWQEGNAFVSVEGDKANFGVLSANLGVGSDKNHADPAGFPNDSPLNISNADDMHWSWNPGYIFVKVEAKVDTIPDGIPLFDHNVVLHVGLDENLQSLNLTDLTWVSVAPDRSQISLKLDMARFLQNNGQTIDLKTEYSSHSAPGQEALSLKVIENFKAAIDKL